MCIETPRFRLGVFCMYREKARDLCRGEWTGDSRRYVIRSHDPRVIVRREYPRQGLRARVVAKNRTGV